MFSQVRRAVKKATGSEEFKRLIMSVDMGDATNPTGAVLAEQSWIGDAAPILTVKRLLRFEPVVPFDKMAAELGKLARAYTDKTGMVPEGVLGVTGVGIDEARTLQDVIWPVRIGRRVDWVSIPGSGEPFRHAQNLRRSELVGVIKLAVQRNTLLVPRTLPLGKELAAAMKAWRGRPVRTMEHAIDEWRGAPGDALVVPLALTAWRAQKKPAMGSASPVGVSRSDVAARASMGPRLRRGSTPSYQGVIDSYHLSGGTGAASFGDAMRDFEQRRGF